jgi:hypothetical protein
LAGRSHITTADAIADREAAPVGRSVPAARAMPPLFFAGTILVLAGFATYFSGILLSVVRLALSLDEPFRSWRWSGTAGSR